MPETKVIEIRDEGTFMVGIATLLRTDPWPFSDEPERNNREQYLLNRIGFSRSCTYNVLLYIPSFKEAQYDPAAWTDRRTIPTVHRYLMTHWDEADPLVPVDVRWILGETPQPCESEEVRWP